MNTDPLPAPELSRAGHARKAVILRDLDVTMRNRNAHRIIRRATLVTAIAIALPAAIWFASPSPCPGLRPIAPPAPIHAVAPDRPTVPNLPDLSPAPPATALSFALVSTDPGIADRLAAPQPEPIVRLISDIELQSLLAGQGDATGLIRTGGRVYLASDVEPPESGAPAGNDTSG